MAVLKNACWEIYSGVSYTTLIVVATFLYSCHVCNPAHPMKKSFLCHCFLSPNQQCQSSEGKR